LLNRTISTICRELERNSGQRGYRPKQAHGFAVERRQKALKHKKLTVEVVEWIVRLIRQDLSPEQVVNYLKYHKGLSLHHETVYQLIYGDKARGGDLFKHLRTASKPYRKRYGHYDSRGTIKDRVSIDERPAVVDERSRLGGRYGYWERPCQCTGNIGGTQDALYGDYAFIRQACCPIGADDD